MQRGLGRCHTHLQLERGLMLLSYKFPGVGRDAAGCLLGHPGGASTCALLLLGRFVLLDEGLPRFGADALRACGREGAIALTTPSLMPSGPLPPKGKRVPAAAAHTATYMATSTAYHHKS